MMRSSRICPILLRASPKHTSLPLSISHDVYDGYQGALAQAPSVISLADRAPGQQEQARMLIADSGVLCDPHSAGMRASR